MKISVARILFGFLSSTLLICGAPARAQLSSYTNADAFPGLTFSSPVCLAAPPGETNRLFVLEQAGVIVVITNLANPTRTVFMDISGRVTAGGEQGLLGLAFHPGYESNRNFYVFYTGPATNGTSGSHDILSRFQSSASDPNQGDTDSEERLLAQYDEAANHNGGDLHFGPDNHLYVSLGDEGGGNDSFDNSQRIDKDFFSGILRLDVDKRPGSLAPHAHPASSTNYAVPADNPFVGAISFNGSSVTPANVRTEFWAVGLRNPWRFSFDPATGLLYCGDVGQGAREEVDIIARGGNYGWAYREGSQPGPNTPPGGFTSIAPIVDYDRGSGPTQGSCVTGGVVYRGSRFPDLTGDYFYADFISGNVWALQYDGMTASTPQRLFGDAGISAFGIDPSTGDILCANYANSIIERIVPVAPPGSLQVTIDPPGAVLSGAKWRVNGGPFQNSGDTVSGLGAGTHAVSFKSVSGWDAPAGFTVAIGSGVTTTTNAAYLSNDTTRPTLAIASPKSGQRLSNDVFTASGMAKDNVLVAEVWFQLNGNAWTPAAGTTNWIAGLTLTPGNNTLRAYAVDTNGRIAKTNSVSFVYVVSVPLTVQIVGAGSVSPNYNSRLLEIGKTYTMTAKAAKGSAFVNWTGSISNGKTKLTFVMASNLTFTATFVDSQKPIVIVTFPPVNKKVTNALLDATGKASDNIGVDSAWYQLNGAGWAAAGTTNGWTNWLAAGLVPDSGGNLLQARAADAAGNISKTNSVKFVYLVVPSPDWAPDALSGLTAVATPDSESPTELSFDAFTFSEAGASTNDDFSVGGYAYVKTGTNTAQLTLTHTAPPTRTNDPVISVALVFTNHYGGIFTSDEGSGTISLSIATNFAPTSLSGKKLIVTGSDGTNTTIALNKSNGTFIKTPSNSGAGATRSGTYAFTRVSPIGAMLVLTFTGADAGTVVYGQMTFDSGKTGSFLVTAFAGLGNPTDTDLGTFTVR